MQWIAFLGVLQRSFWRERSAVLWTFLFPLVVLVCLGAAFAGAPQPFASVALDDRDGGEVSRRIRTALIASGWFHAEAGNADAVLRVPKGASRAALETRGPPANLRLRFATEDAQRQYAIYGLLSAELLRLNQEESARGVSLALRGKPGQRLGTPEARAYAEFLVYGLVGLNVLSTALFGVGVGSAWFREEGIFARLWLSAARVESYLVAHLLHITLLLVASTGLLLGAGSLLFGVAPPRPDTFAAAMATGSFALLPWGFALAARSTSTRVAQMWANALYFPLMLLSGVYFRAESMSEGLARASAWLPLKPFLDALRAASDGASVSALAPELGILGVWGIVGCVAARGVFRWND